MLEKLQPTLPSPKADPRAILRANERSVLGDRADEQREDAAGGFGQVLAEDAAARRMAQKPVEHKSERPRHERRAESGKPEGNPASASHSRSPDGDADETACVMNGPQDEAVSLGKRNPLGAVADTPACRLPGEVSTAAEDLFCVGMPLPDGLINSEMLADAQPELPSEICARDLISVAAESADPSVAVAMVEFVQPEAALVETPEEATKSLAASDPVMLALKQSEPAGVVGMMPMAVRDAGEAVSIEEGALAVSLDGQRKVVARQAVDSAPLDKAQYDVAQLDVAIAQGLPEGKATKTSVPIIPLELASVRSGEGKGFQPHVEAISGPAGSFAELIRDFAPHQGMGGLRAADPLSALDKAGTFGFAVQDNQRPTPLQMLPIEMGMQAMRGNTRFQIRLDPPELGRVDVKLEISSSGEVKANMVVDRVETLAMLRRDSQSLQYAFEQAGLKQAPDGLTFSLRGEGQNGQQAHDRREDQGRPGAQDNELALLETAAAEKAMRRVSIPLSRIDLVI